MWKFGDYGDVLLGFRAVISVVVRTCVDRCWCTSAAFLHFSTACGMLRC